MIVIRKMDLDMIGDVDEMLGPFWRRGEIAGDRENGYDVTLAEATIIRTSQMLPDIKISLGGVEIGVSKCDFEKLEVL